MAMDEEGEKGRWGSLKTTLVLQFSVVFLKENNENCVEVKSIRPMDTDCD